MVNLFISHPYHNRHSIGAIISGTSLFGMLMIIIGIYHISLNGIFPTDRDTYDITKIIMMSFVLCIGLYALNQKATMEGISMILVGISTVASSAANLMNGQTDLQLLNFLLGIGLLITTIAFYSRKDIVLAIGTGTAAFGFLLSPAFEDPSMLMGITATISGFMYLAYGFHAWYTVCTDNKRYPWEEDELAHSADIAVGTAGFMVMGVLSILVGVYYLNKDLNLIFIDPTTYNITKILMSVVILYYAGLAIRKGSITSGMMSLFFGSSTLTFSVCAMMGLGGLEIADIMLGIGMLTASVIAYKEKNMSTSMVGFLVFIAFSIYPFLKGDIVYWIVGAPIFIIGLILLFDSIKNIYVLEIEPYKHN